MHGGSPTAKAKITVLMGGGILVTLAEDEYAKQKERINDNTS